MTAHFGVTFGPYAETRGDFDYLTPCTESQFQTAVNAFGDRAKKICVHMSGTLTEGVDYYIEDTYGKCYFASCDRVFEPDENGNQETSIWKIHRLLLTIQTQAQ